MKKDNFIEFENGSKIEIIECSSVKRSNIKIDQLPCAFEMFERLTKDLTRWQKIRNFIIYDIPYWFIINWYKLKDKIKCR